MAAGSSFLLVNLINFRTFRAARNFALSCKVNFAAQHQGHFFLSAQHLYQELISILRTGARCCLFYRRRERFGARCNLGQCLIKVF